LYQIRFPRTSYLANRSTDDSDIIKMLNRATITPFVVFEA